MKFVTKNTIYTLIDQGDGAFLISGNERYCPVPTPCTLMSPVEVGKSVLFNTYQDVPHGKWVITTPVRLIVND